MTENSLAISFPSDTTLTATRAERVVSWLKSSPRELQMATLDRSAMASVWQPSTTASLEAYSCSCTWSTRATSASVSGMAQSEGVTVP